MSSHEIHYSILIFSENLKLSSEIELNFLSQFLVDKTEGDKYNDIKQMFDSLYVLSIKQTINSGISCHT